MSLLGIGGPIQTATKAQESQKQRSAYEDSFVDKSKDFSTLLIRDRGPTDFAARFKQTRQQAAIESPETAWNSAMPCSVTKYTEGKVIDTHGCRWHPTLNCLLVPLQTVDGEIQSLQLIYDDGMKLFWPDVSTDSLFFLIGTIHSEVLICKGVATGSSLRIRTGNAVACAMSHGNLLAVADAFRNHFPNLQITICGDDERQTVGNLGRTKATEAASAIGANLAMPELCQGCDCTDFNDKANCSHGVEI